MRLAYKWAIRLKLLQKPVDGKLRRLLLYGDRSPIAYSVESLLLNLENSLVRLVNSLPEPFLLSPGSETNHILWAALSGLAPHAELKSVAKCQLRGG